MLVPKLIPGGAASFRWTFAACGADDISAGGSLLMLIPEKSGATEATKAGAMFRNGAFLQLHVMSMPD